MLDALRHTRFLYIAGSADFSTPIEFGRSYEAGLRNVHLQLPSYVNGVLNIPRNYIPHRNTLTRAEQIIESHGLLGIHLHIENDYHGARLLNGITTENLGRLEKLIDFIDAKYGNGYVWRTTFSEIAKKA